MKITPEILKKKRAELGLSQQEVATAIGVSQKSYSMYEEGERSPKIDKVLKLAEVLKIEVDFRTNVPVGSEKNANVDLVSGELKDQMLMQLINNQTTLVNSNSRLVDNAADLTQMLKARFTVDALVQSQSDGPSIIDKLLEVAAEVGVPKKWRTKEAGMKALRKLVYGDSEALIAAGRSHE